MYTKFATATHLDRLPPWNIGPILAVTCARTYIIFLCIDVQNVIVHGGGGSHLRAQYIVHLREICYAKRNNGLSDDDCKNYHWHSKRVYIYDTYAVESEKLLFHSERFPRITTSVYLRSIRNKMLVLPFCLLVLCTVFSLCKRFFSAPHFYP